MSHLSSVLIVLLLSWNVFAEDDEDGAYSESLKRTRENIEATTELLDRLRKMKVKTTQLQDDVLAMTVCVDSLCLEEYKQKSAIVAGEDHLVVALLISFSSGSSEIVYPGDGLVALTFREIFLGSGYFKKYRDRKISRLEIIGHADLEEVAEGEVFDREGNTSCKNLGLSPGSNKCLARVRSQVIEDIVLAEIRGTFGVDSQDLSRVVGLYHEDPFLSLEEARFPGFLRKIDAWSDRSRVLGGLGIPADYLDRGVAVRERYEGAIPVEHLQFYRDAMAKFRSVIVVVQFH